MNCNGFETELRKTVERRETTRRAELIAHVEGCPHCAARWEQHELLEQAVAAWKGRVPPVDLADRVMAHWAFEGGTDSAPLTAAPGGPSESGSALRPSSVTTNLPNRNMQRFGRWAIVGAAAAVLVILLSPLLWRADEDQPVPMAGGPATQPQQRPAQDPVSAVARAMPPVRVDTAVREAGSAWLGLAKEATGTVQEMAAFLPERTLAAVSPGDVEPQTPEPAWTEKLRNEIAPIQRDVGRAMDFLFDTVPLGRNRAI